MFPRIFRFIKSALSISVKDSCKAEFAVHIDRINVTRAKITSLCFVVVEAFAIIASIIAKNFGLFVGQGFFYMDMHLFLFAVMSVYFLVFFRLGKNVEANGKVINIIGVSFTAMILSWCAVITLMDQVTSGQVIVYTVAAMAIAVTPFCKPLVMLSVYGVVHTAFLALIPFFQKSQTILFGNVVNTTTFVMVSLAISYMRYKRVIDDFGNRKLIQEKSSELERINKELEEANRKLEKISRTDSLTGVFNRYMFDEAIKMEWNRCKRNFVPLSLIMIDIDFFKTYNDSLGHMVGDDCIKQVANVLKLFTKRSSDIVARYGGDEFAIVLPYMGKESALSLAEQIRKKVEEQGISSADTAVSEILTISVGVNSVIPTSHMSLNKFINDADAALYKAKESRNSIFVASV